MPIPKKIPKTQLNRVKELEGVLELYASAGNLKKAKLALNELKEILSKYGHDARIMQGYLKLYEAALESWDLDLAKRGFRFVRNNTNKKTRTYLEATTLLAIAYLRDQDLVSAEPLMASALKDEYVIKSESKRAQFRREVIERFDQEGALAALGQAHPDLQSEAQIHQDAIKLLKEGKNEDELHEIIGNQTPQSVKDFLLKVDGMSKNLLPHEERLLLPSPKEVIKNKQVGKVIFNGVRRKLYRYICKEDSEVYQAWLKGGIESILSKGYIASAVIGAMADIRIGASAIAVGVSAMLMKLGVANFCDKNHPISLMGLRKKKNKRGR